MDDPLVLAAAAVVVPFALGLLLRLKGAVLGAVALCVAAVVLAVDGGGSSTELLGAAVLGGAGGFALGWAGSLSRRLRRRR